GEFATENTSADDSSLTQGTVGSGTRSGSSAVHSAAGGEFQAGAGADLQEEDSSNDRPLSKKSHVTESSEARLDERPANYQHASEPARATSSEMQSEPIGQAEYTSQIPQDLVNQPLDSFTEKRVHNNNGDQIGKVDNVVANLRDGKVGFVVSSGGVLGIGERKLLAPVEELKLHEDELIWDT